MAASAAQPIFFSLPPELRIYIYEPVFFPQVQTLTVYRRAPRLPSRLRTKDDDIRENCHRQQLQLKIQILQDISNHRPFPSCVSDIPCTHYPIHPGNQRYPTLLSTRLEAYMKYRIITLKREVKALGLHRFPRDYSNITNNNRALLQVNRALREDAIEIFYKRRMKIHCATWTQYVSSLDPVARGMVRQVEESRGQGHYNFLLDIMLDDHAKRLLHVWPPLKFDWDGEAVEDDDRA